MSALNRYYREIRGAARPEKLAELLADLKPRGFTKAWLELHKLVLTERERLAEAAAKLPELLKARKAAHEAIDDDIGFAQSKEHKAAREKLAMEWQRLHCACSTAQTQSDELEGMLGAFPVLLQSGREGGSLGLPPAVANALIGILGDQVDRCETFDVPPQDEDTSNILWE
ncbi:MAG TPA: hypothetical protein VMY42_09585 [Thermoguttaceae bacterium]|nr:hypothetical protein [Thermoguttaceae bacterium]